MRLVLVHGRLAYLRVTKLLVYNFYKDVLLTSTSLWWSFFNGFSVQSFYLHSLSALFNTVLTGWTCLIQLLLEVDVNDQYTYKFPIIYKPGQIGLYFNLKLFWKFILSSIVHSTFAFFIPFYVRFSPIISIGYLVNH